MLVGGLPVEPDVTALAVEWLTVQLDRAGQGQWVSSNVPADRPERFVVVRSDGGPETSLTTFTAQIVVHVYDVDEERAAKTAVLCARLMRAAPGYRIAGFPFVRSALKTGGPTDWPDPDIRDVTRIQVVMSWQIRLA